AGVFSTTGARIAPGQLDSLALGRVRTVEPCQAVKRSLAPRVVVTTEKLLRRRGCQLSIPRQPCTVAGTGTAHLIGRHGCENRSGQSSNCQTGGRLRGRSRW